MTPVKDYSDPAAVAARHREEAGFKKRGESTNVGDPVEAARERREQAGKQAAAKPSS